MIQVDCAMYNAQLQSCVGKDTQEMVEKEFL